MYKILVKNVENNRSEWVNLPIDLEILGTIFIDLSMTTNDSEDDYNCDMGIFEIIDYELDIPNIHIGSNDDIEYLNEFIQAYIDSDSMFQYEIDGLIEACDNWEEAYDVFSNETYEAYHHMELEDILMEYFDEDEEDIDFFVCDNGITIVFS